MPVMSLKNEGDDFVSNGDVMTSALSMVRISKGGTAAECRAVIKRITARNDKAGAENVRLHTHEDRAHRADN
jgi:hypothetical protein